MKRAKSEWSERLQSDGVLLLSFCALLVLPCGGQQGLVGGLAHARLKIVSEERSSVTNCGKKK